MTCARCHDHKFDPIPQKDYYSLRGIFDSCVEPKIEPVIGKISNTPEYLDYYRQREQLAKAEETIRGQPAAAAQKPRPRSHQKGATGFAADRTRHQRTGVDQCRRAAARDGAGGHGARDTIRRCSSAAKPATGAKWCRAGFCKCCPARCGPVYTNGSGRLELALAIASPNNPLTRARDDQPHLAASFWRGLRADAGRFRHDVRAAEPSRNCWITWR